MPPSARVIGAGMIGHVLEWWSAIERSLNMYAKPADLASAKGSSCVYAAAMQVLGCGNEEAAHDNKSVARRDEPMRVRIV